MSLVSHNPICLTLFPTYSWHKCRDCGWHHNMLELELESWSCLALSQLEQAQKDYVRVYSWISPAPSGDISTMSHRRWSIQLVPQTPSQPPWLSCLSCTLGWFPVSSAPYSFLSPPSLSLPPPPLEFTGSLAQHGNDIINRKKWTGRKRERERTVNTVLCYSHVRLSASSTLHFSTTRPSCSLPQLPACLLAAVQSYEVVMSLVVMSITLNPTSHRLNKRLKETSQWKLFFSLIFFSCPGHNTLGCWCGGRLPCFPSNCTQFSK